MADVTINWAPVLGLSVVAVAVIGCLAISGSGSLRRGLRNLGKDIADELPAVAALAVLGGLILLVAFVSGGDAVTFLAVGAAVLAGLVIVVVLLVRWAKRSAPSDASSPRATVERRNGRGPCA